MVIMLFLLGLVLLFTPLATGGYDTLHLHIAFTGLMMAFAALLIGAFTV